MDIYEMIRIVLYFPSEA